MYSLKILDIINALSLSGLEPPTLRLSGVYSNQLSYKLYLILNCMTLIKLNVTMQKLENVRMVKQKRI